MAKKEKMQHGPARLGKVRRQLTFRQSVADRLDAHLGTLEKRVYRNEWVESAIEEKLNRETK